MTAVRASLLLPILVAVTAVGPMAMHIILPSMPGLQRVFDTDYGTVQLALTVYLFGVAVSQLVYGPVSDRFGRRTPLLLGLGLFVLGSVMCMLAQSIEWFIGGRIVQALGGSAGIVLTRAIVRDLYERDRAASMIAYVTMAMVIAPMMAPTIGGYLDDSYNWRATFIFVAAAGALALLFATAKLPETHVAERMPVSLTGLFAGFGALLTIRRYYGYSLQVTFATSAFFAFLAGAPYVTVEVLGLSATQFGLYFIAISIMFMIGNFATARVSARLGVDTMLSVGAVLTMSGAIGLLVVSLTGNVTTVTLFGFMGLIAMGNGLTLPNGIAGAVSVSPRLVGAASGLTGFMQMTVSAVISYIVGKIVVDDPNLLGIAIFLCMTLAVAAHILINLILARREEPTPQSS